MKKKITKKQKIRSKVDKLVENETFITWVMLGVSPYNNYYQQTYEAKLVLDYMKELGLDYLRYSDKFSDKNQPGITSGFYNPIAKRRKRKLQQVFNNLKN